MKTVLLIIAMIALTIAVPCLIYLTKQIKQYEKEIMNVKTDLKEVEKVLHNSTIISASPQNDWHYICYSCKYINYCQESGKKPVDESSCADYAQKGSEYDE